MFAGGAVERMAIFAFNTYLHLCLDHHPARQAWCRSWVR
jgi:hypothetical protein